MRFSKDAEAGACQVPDKFEGGAALVSQPDEGGRRLTRRGKIRTGGV